MKFGFAGCAEIIRLQRIGCSSEIFQSVAWFQARESEMRRVGACFTREAERFERFFDSRGEFGEIGRGLDAAPKHARLEFIREKTENAEIHCDRSRGANGRERGADFGKFLRVRFAQEFQ